MSYPARFTKLADQDALLKEYLGKTKSELPTPSLIVNRSTFKNNCIKMLQNAKAINASFRAHIKTHKTLEGTVLQLGNDKVGNKTDRLVVSTLMEAWNLMPLVEQGLVTDILFSLPVIESRLSELNLMTNKYPQLKLRLMLDNYEQLDILSNFNIKNSVVKRWSVFVKVDMGTKRAGLVAGGGELEKVVTALATTDSKYSKYVSLYGFYCHAGHSYGSRSIDQARSLLVQEIENGNNACKQAVELDPSMKLVISVGSTPTGHASSSTSLVLKEIEQLGQLFGELELHAGNYACCDLQQLGTKCISEESISCSVLADVISSYPDRGDKSPGEQLINAGVIAMSRESGPLPGFGNISKPTEFNNWIIGRLSQEHGIIIPQSDDCKLLPLGTRVEIIPQHICITAASYPWYYIFDSADENATVVDIWVPFRGW